MPGDVYNEEASLPAGVSHRNLPFSAVCVGRVATASSAVSTPACVLGLNDAAVYASLPKIEILVNIKPPTIVCSPQPMGPRDSTRKYAAEVNLDLGKQSQSPSEIKRINGTIDGVLNRGGGIVEGNGKVRKVEDWGGRNRNKQAAQACKMVPMDM